MDGTVKFTDLRRAVVFGSVLASYNVEQFSLERMRTLTQKDIQDRYDMVDVNVYQESIFHTKMKLKELDLDTYLFGAGEADLTSREAKLIRGRVNHEISEIFYGRNIQRGA